MRRHPRFAYCERQPGHSGSTGSATGRPPGFAKFRRARVNVSFCSPCRVSIGPTGVSPRFVAVPTSMAGPARGVVAPSASPRGRAGSELGSRSRPAPTSPERRSPVSRFRPSRGSFRVPFAWLPLPCCPYCAASNGPIRRCRHAERIPDSPGRPSGRRAAIKSLCAIAPLIRLRESTQIHAPKWPRIGHIRLLPARAHSDSCFFELLPLRSRAFELATGPMKVPPGLPGSRALLSLG